eukprot:s5740_g5.t1
MLFCRWGEEHVVDQFAEFFTNMVRRNPNKLPQVREYYRKCSWELAMHMRSNGSFADGVKQIVSARRQRQGQGQSGQRQRGQGEAGRQDNPPPGLPQRRPDALRTPAVQVVPARFLQVRRCLAEDQEAWLATSPRHVREVYKQGSDAKYNNPRQIVSNPRADEHAETMLQEVQKEATKVLPFGSVASVWSYVRFADAACCISVATLFAGAAHFVDDFFECEAEQSADHGFQCFQAQHRVFGTKMKEAKAKPPSSHQTLLGVDWKISQSELLASPGTKRIAKVREMIGRALLEDRLHPSEAAKLAGKLNFICSWVFSNVPVFVLYADAYTTLSGSRRSANRFSAGQLLLRPSSFGLRCWHNCSQSWQFFRTFAGTYILCFVDNSAAQHALTKGYSKDVSFTKVLGCFSRFLASKSVALSFHRVTSVTSSANVSDSVSREDWSLAAELGCQLEEFDFNEGYAWLSQVPRGPKGALPEVRPVRPQASRAESTAGSASSEGSAGTESSAADSCSQSSAAASRGPEETPPF